MSSFPGTPKVVKGGIVVINPETAAIEKIIPLQYNPDTITRTLQVHGAGGDGAGQRSEPMRLSGPPSETIKLEAELDATDKMEAGDTTTAQAGIQPQLAVLETLLYPSSTHLVSNNSMASAGTIEIAPMESSLTLFIWSKNRIVPVRITSFSITEEAFDINLNPLRAKLSLEFKVLSVDDLGFDHKGGSLYMTYQQNKESLAKSFSSGALSNLGIKSIS